MWDTNISESEMLMALFSMGSSKSPGPDGYSPGFFKKEWQSMKTSILKLVQEAFNRGVVPESLNKTYITLIPKTDAPDDLSGFRPISLYKLIPKIIVNRMKPFLDTIVSPIQSSFIAGRQGINNVVIAKEIIHHFKYRKAFKVGWLGKLTWRKHMTEYPGNFLTVFFFRVAFQIIGRILYSAV